MICFLALALWRTLEQTMGGKGLGDCARHLLHELHSMGVVLPTHKGDDGLAPGEVGLRVVARPGKPLAQLPAAWTRRAQRAEIRATPCGPTRSPCRS